MRARHPFREVFREVYDLVSILTPDKIKQNIFAFLQKKFMFLFYNFFQFANIIFEVMRNVLWV
jgi:hypothetical protein